MSYLTRLKLLGIALTALTSAWLFVVPKPLWAQQTVPGLHSQVYLLEVDSNYVKQQMLRQILDEVRSTLREAGISRPISSSIKGDAVEVRVQDAELPTALAKLRDWSQQIGEFLGSNNQSEVVDAGGGLIRLGVPEAVIVEQLPRITEQQIQIIERRVSELGTAEPIVRRQGTNRILVQIPGLHDPTRLKPIHSGDDTRLDFRVVDTSVSPDQAQQGVPPDSELLMSASAPKIPYVVKKQVLVSGDDIIDARSGFDPRTNEPVVNVKFNMSGARRFARARAENVGLPFAVILGGRVIAAPLGFEPVTRGQGQLSGNFTVASAKDLARLLRTSGPSVPLLVVEERTIGQDSIESDGVRATGRSDPTAAPFQPSHRD